MGSVLINPIGNPIGTHVPSDSSNDATTDGGEHHAWSTLDPCQASYRDAGFRTRPGHRPAIGHTDRLCGDRLNRLPLIALGGDSCQLNAVHDDADHQKYPPADLKVAQLL